MHILALSLVLLLVHASASVSNAQNNREVLTNEKILQMVKLDLGEEIIVQKINQSECQCDTSTAALAKLQAAKVPKSIIMAMLNATAGYSETAPAPASKGPTNNNDVGGNGVSLDDEKLLRQVAEPGIYLSENGKMTVIEPSVFSGSKMSFWKTAVTYGIAKSKMKAKVRGNTANLKAAGPLPVFYFVFNPAYKDSGAAMAGGWWGLPATSPAEFVMVQMTQKDKTREAVLGEYGTWSGMETGARDKDIREYSFEKIKPGVYKVTPKVNLTAGEYAFYYAGNVTGLGIAGGKVFDFSVLR